MILWNIISPDSWYIGKGIVCCGWSCGLENSNCIWGMTRLAPEPSAERITLDQFLLELYAFQYGGIRSTSCVECCLHVEILQTIVVPSDAVRKQYKCTWFTISITIWSMCLHLQGDWLIAVWCSEARKQTPVVWCICCFPTQPPTRGSSWIAVKPHQRYPLLRRSCAGVSVHDFGIKHWKGMPWICNYSSLFFRDFFFFNQNYEIFILKTYLWYPIHPIWGNLLFVHLSLNLYVQELRINAQHIKSLSCLMMSWFLSLSGYHQTWYWLCVKEKFFPSWNESFKELEFQGSEYQVQVLYCIWVRSQRCGCPVTKFCYQMIAKPGNKTAALSWPDPYLDV